MRTQVLIVGAGPTGLVLAAELHRRGTAFRIIDKHPGVLEATKAAALHARALEYFRDLGVADRIVAEGQRVDILTLRTGYRDRLGVDFRVSHDTRYPHMVDIPQARTEHILIDHLTDLGVTIERGMELTGLRQTGDGVEATVTVDGRTDTVVADWVVGCDGVRSPVRNLLGLEFPGADYADDWVLCDAELDWPLPRNEMTFSGDTEGIYGVFPLPGRRRYRLAYTQSRDDQGRPVEPDLADAQRAMARTGIDGTVLAAEQFWTFNLAHRQAGAVRRGRVFLAGDAGHVHTPFGGQGLNLGVGDAVNLGWKLAEVCAGRAPAVLLDSYQAERHHVAAQVVTFTHLGAEAMLLRADPRRHLRDAALAALATAAPARRQMARRLSQLAHSYRGTPFVDGRAGRLHAGDRLPDLPVFDGAGHTTVRLHDALSPAGYTLLAAGADRGLADQVAQAVTALTSRWHLDLRPLLVTPDWRTAARAGANTPVLLDRARDAAPLYSRRPAAYLVRPDRHIGYAGRLDLAAIERHLTLTATLHRSAAAA